MDAQPRSFPATDYQVRLDVFEGPLDLLLYLVRKEEVEIYDLSLERLTQQYLDYLAAVPQPDLDRAGDFIAMAAHLIYLKSRRLLPPEQVAGADDAAEEEDPRWELIRQLVEYKKFKDVAGHLQAWKVSGWDCSRALPLSAPEVDREEEMLSGALALGDIGVFDLLRAFQKDTHAPFRGKDGGPQHGHLRGELHGRGQDRAAARADDPGTRAGARVYVSCSPPPASRVELVVTFLALLELVRLKQLRVEQGAAVRGNPHLPAGNTGAGGSSFRRPDVPQSR